MVYAKDMPFIPSSGWGSCADTDCPGKSSRQKAFGYLVDFHDSTRTTLMTQIDERWVRNGRKKVALVVDADGSR